MLRNRVEETNQRGAAATAATAVAQAEVRLIVRIAARDLRAFEELYRTYHARLTRFLERLTRRRDAFVEELLNDTMLVVWKRADSYNGRSKVSTWIFAIAYRKALKALRGVDDAAEDLEPEQHASADPGPEQQLEQRQLRNVLG
jgi:RNA polymerase sigma-70 factor (ECF subfamily)